MESGCKLHSFSHSPFLSVLLQIFIYWKHSYTGIALEILCVPLLSEQCLPEYYYGMDH